MAWKRPKVNRYSLNECLDKYQPKDYTQYPDGKRFTNDYFARTFNSWYPTPYGKEDK